MHTFSRYADVANEPVTLQRDPDTPDTGNRSEASPIRQRTEPQQPNRETRTGSDGNS